MDVVEGPEVTPSPKFQLYVMGSPFGSEEPAPEKLTVNGAGPFVGEAVMTAVGGLFVPLLYRMTRTSLAFTPERRLM